MESAIAVMQEIHHHNRGNRYTGNKTISLETYLNYYHTHEYTNLNVDQLNKIVSIHGFKKAKYKKDVEEIMSKITEPIHPARSTLEDGIPSTMPIKAAVTLTEAIKDLKLLNWLQCSVTSIKTISSKKFPDAANFPITNFSNAANVPITNYPNADKVPITDLNEVPLSEVAANLMFLKGIMCHKPPSPLATDATSMMSDGSGLSRNGSEPSGSCDSGVCVSYSMVSMVPGFGTKKKRSFRSSERGTNSGGCVQPSKVTVVGVERREENVKLRKSGTGSDSCVSPSMAPEIGVKKRKAGIKRVYLMNVSQQQ